MNIQVTATGSNIIPSNRKHASKDNTYQPTDMGPYFVFVEGENGNVGKLHPMALGRMLFKESNNLRHEIVNISGIGRNRYKIETKTGQSANRLRLQDTFRQKNMEAYIPSFLTTRRGVIRDVDIALSNQEILAEIKSEFLVIDVRRFTKKVIENGVMKIFPTPKCVVTFKSQQLPQYVYLCGMRCPVAPYVQSVLQCHNCLRYFHLSSQCRSNARCAKCMGAHETSQCSHTGEPKCLHCRGNHTATDHCCPVYQQHMETKRREAYSVSYTTDAWSLRPSFAQVTADVPTTQVLSTGDWPKLYEKPVAMNMTEKRLQQGPKHAFMSVPAPKSYKNKPLTRSPYKQGYSDMLYEFHGPQNPIQNNPYPPTPLAASHTNREDAINNFCASILQIFLSLKNDTDMVTTQALIRNAVEDFFKTDNGL